MEVYQKNPFNLSFGRKPNEYIDRYAEVSHIYHMFTEPPVTDQIYVIMGVRGAGKTVAMTDITERIKALKDWIVIKISPIDDIVDALFKILIHDERIRQICVETKIDFSLFGINISASSKDPGQNLNQAIDEILEKLEKRGFKVLIAIDEVTNTAKMQAFISAFQLFITNNRPVFFLGTALFEEIESLRNVRNLTFLYRAPKAVLTPLNTGAIANTYARVFGCTKTQALKMAGMTKGYPLAFQILGYVTWEHRDLPLLSDVIMEEFDQRIAETAYEKLWSELSENDKKVMIAIAKAKDSSVKSIREAADMDPNKLNQYRRRLKERGLIDIQKYGAISFALPRFKEFLETEEFEAFCE